MSCVMLFMNDPTSKDSICAKSKKHVRGIPVFLCSPDPMSQCSTSGNKQFSEPGPSGWRGCAPSERRSTAGQARGGLELVFRIDRVSSFVLEISKDIGTLLFLFHAT